MSSIPMSFRPSNANPYATVGLDDGGATPNSAHGLTDPMSSGNPYAASGSRGYNEKPRNSKKKWYWIIGIIALLVIIGAVLGGVLGTQLNKDDKKNGSSSQDNSSGSGGVPGNTGVPSGIDNVNSAAMTATGANGQAYLAIATDSEWMLPVYATGVSPH